MTYYVKLHKGEQLTAAPVVLNQASWGENDLQKIELFSGKELQTLVHILDLKMDLTAVLNTLWDENNNLNDQNNPLFYIKNLDKPSIKYFFDSKKQAQGHPGEDNSILGAIHRKMSYDPEMMSMSFVIKIILMPIVLPITHILTMSKLHESRRGFIIEQTRNGWAKALLKVSNIAAHVGVGVVLGAVAAVAGYPVLGLPTLGRIFNWSLAFYIIPQMAGVFLLEPNNQAAQEYMRPLIELLHITFSEVVPSGGSQGNNPNHDNAEANAIIAQQRRVPTGNNSSQ